MIKFLVISFLVFFIIYKLLGFFFRLLLRTGINHQQQQHQAHTRQSKAKRPSDGNVIVDYVPNNKKESADKTYNGGEYIDYEEVK